MNHYLIDKELLDSVTEKAMASPHLRKLTENYVVSNAKIKTALGIDGMPVSAHNGMRKTLQSFGKQ